MYNPRIKLYNKLCDMVDDILIRNKVRKTCVICSTIEPINPYDNKLGCCAGCQYLGDNGCTTASLACKLWLCPVVQNMHLIPQNELDMLFRIHDISFKYKLWVFRGSPFIEKET